VADLFAGTPAALAERPELPEFTGARAAAAAARGSRGRPARSPLTARRRRGLLAGVASEFRPTARPGAGDRIVEPGHAIENIYDYTYALDALTGKPVPISVLRDGQRIRLRSRPSRD
jgi:hypothetical protein